MAFCMAIILFVIGYILIHKDDSNVTPEMRKDEKNYRGHRCRPGYEYLLVWGVYAYYANQSRAERPEPYQDAVRHARLEMLRLGYRTTNSLWYDFSNISPDVMKSINNMYHYTHAPSKPWWQTDADHWPFKNTRGANGADALIGPHRSYWLEAIESCQTSTPYEVAQDRYLFNRLAEWYYLVMFKNEYLSLNLDVENTLFDEQSCIERQYRRSEDTIDREWEALLSEIQGIVYWGNAWDAEIRGYQRRAAQYEAEVHRQASEPGRQRRQRLLNGENSSEDRLPTIDEMTPEWAKQQLKEKYGIDYEEGN